MNKKSFLFPLLVVCIKKKEKEKKNLIDGGRIGRFVDFWDPQCGSAQTGERPEW